MTHGVNNENADVGALIQRCKIEAKYHLDTCGPDKALEFIIDELAAHEATRGHPMLTIARRYVRTVRTPTMQRLIDDLHA